MVDKVHADSSVSAVTLTVGTHPKTNDSSHQSPPKSCKTETEKKSILTHFGWKKDTDDKSVYKFDRGCLWETARVESKGYIHDLSCLRFTVF